MFDILFAYFEKGFPLTEKDISLMRSVFLERRIKKGHFLQREGEKARYGAFVTRGFLRSYIIDNKGKEHIVQFAPENWWISDKSGTTEGETTSFFIDAIEDTDALLIDTAGHNKLIENMPGYAAMFQSGIQKRGAAKDKRIVHSLSATAEERYNDFLKTYPSIAMRVPQHMLASYLGITPETLSRIRKLQSLRK